MTIVINFFGGPGIGKSTLSTGLFSEMKRQNYSVEYVSEYAKDITWEETPKLLENQLHIFSEQFRRQFRLKNKVDYIITDSPILLSSIYYDYLLEKHESHSEEFSNSFKNLVACSFLFEFENINIRILRNKGYMTIGRNQTLEQAKELDQYIDDRLDHYHLLSNSITVESTDSPVDILNCLLATRSIVC